MNPTRIRPSPGDTARQGGVGQPAEVPSAGAVEETLQAPALAEATLQRRPLHAADTHGNEALVSGTVLRGRYVLEDPIGQGAMGQVWRARDQLAEEARARNPYVAVKVLNSDFEGHAEAFVAMHREASRAHALAHPNIVTVYIFDRDERSGRAFIAMELLEGQPLDRALREQRGAGLPRAQALPILRGMAEGLAYAHRKGIVHADFKPGNVFLTRDGTPKILDFGIARVMHASDAEDSTFHGYTPNYAAPETIRGGDPSPAQDVFALGIVAYELLAGRHPFERRPADEACAAGVAPQPISGLKRREWKAIERALAYERSLRPQDASAFLKRLQGMAPLQKALIAAVAVLVAVAGVLGFRSYTASLPAVPFAQLPAPVQAEIRAALDQGSASLAYIDRTGDIVASADAAQYFAQAYALHPRNREAVAGLRRSADLAISWYEKMPDQRQAREELRRFQMYSEFYRHYRPLVRAIGDAE